MTGDSSTPTPILSREEVAAMPSYLSLADSMLLRRSHEALRDAVAVLTEERDEAQRQAEYWHRKYHDLPGAARVAVLEVGLRELLAFEDEYPPDESGYDADEFERVTAIIESARALLGGTEPAAADLVVGLNDPKGEPWTLPPNTAGTTVEPATAPPVYERIGQAVLEDHGWSFDDRTDVDWSDTGWVPVYRRVPAAAPEPHQHGADYPDSWKRAWHGGELIP